MDCPPGLTSFIYPSLESEFSILLWYIGSRHASLYYSHATLPGGGAPLSATQGTRLYAMFPQREVTTTTTIITTTIIVTSITLLSSFRTYSPRHHHYQFYPKCLKTEKKRGGDKSEEIIIQRWHRKLPGKCIVKQWLNRRQNKSEGMMLETELWKKIM